MADSAQQLHRYGVVGAAFVVLVALAAVGAHQLSDAGDALVPPRLVESRLLTFADGPEASVVVRDELGREVTRFARGTNGFARVLLRGMARERRKHGLNLDAPFELGRTASGALYLIDPHTPTRITLDAFGVTNAGVFAELLKAGVPELAAHQGELP